MDASTKSLDEVACKSICDRFQIHKLTSEQEKAITSILNGFDVFVGTKTGSGKSLTYECLPILCPDSCVIIVSPLVSIMEEQCRRLTGLGFRATYIGRDPTDNEGLESGNFNFVFASPEVLVGETKWRDVLKTEVYQRKLKLLVVDEAHTVIHWGEGKSGDGPFRQWFSRIAELRSLCLGVPLAALTATSGPVQRRAIMRKLAFRSNAVVVLDSPDRENIKITVQKIRNNAKIQQTFSWLISGLQENSQEFPRHVVFCASISDCAKIYQTFAMELGLGCELIQMFHSQTNERVKDKIRIDMADDNGKIRVLVCTNAAGMGVNFHLVHNVVHYGLPRELDTFVQQMGRAGRDGQFSHELVLYKVHKGHMKRIEPELVKLVQDDNCRHKQLCQNYLFTNKQIVPVHKCCDICATDCKCGAPECPVQHPYLVHFSQGDEAEQGPSSEFVRQVTESEREILRLKLSSLRYSLESPELRLFSDELVHGLSDAVIEEICTKCHLLSSPEDVLGHIACWSYSMATKIANCVGVVFGGELFQDDSESTDSDD